jgi:hypothetical protein
VFSPTNIFVVLFLDGEKMLLMASIKSIIPSGKEGNFGLILIRIELGKKKKRRNGLFV